VPDHDLWSETTARRPNDDPGRTERLVAIGLAGLAGVALAVGTVSGLTARAKLDDALASPHCRGDVCDREGGAIVDDAKDWATVSTVSFIAAAGALAAAAVLWFTAPRPSRP
jgi:hypothetical protein